MSINNLELQTSPLTFRPGVDSPSWKLTDWIVGTASVLLALGSASFFTVSYVISIKDPSYFENQLLASLPPKLDPIMTGTVAGAPSDAMPAQTIVRDYEPSPSDYQIVMLFEDEALLTLRQELMRVKPGSTLPGLGKVLAIEPRADGGLVKTEVATLQIAAPKTASAQ